MIFTTRRFFEVYDLGIALAIRENFEFRTSNNLFSRLTKRGTYFGMSGYILNGLVIRDGHFGPIRNVYVD